MRNRSATSSIKGYYYQFLMTIKDILASKNDSIITVEGIEDLDITNPKFESLHQYKYHELANYTNSLVCKPICLMLSDFLNKSDSNKGYQLLIYLPQDLPQFDFDRVKKIVSLKAANDYVNTDLITDQTIRDFTKVLSVKKTSSFTKLEEQIIELIAKEVNVSVSESTNFYLPNCIKRVMDLSIQSNIVGRRITKYDFLNDMNKDKDTLETEYFIRVKGYEKAKNRLLEVKSNRLYKKNNSDHILYFANHNELNFNIVYNSIKLFFYEGNKSDNRPLTVIVDDSRLFKKNFIRSTKKLNENIVFNDGYEDYGFSKNYFNSRTLNANTPKRGRVNQVSYNFKVISIKSFEENRMHLKFVNPIIFSLESEVPNIIEQLGLTINIKGFSIDQSLEIIGG